jgi:hypothetical protein
VTLAGRDASAVRVRPSTVEEKGPPFPGANQGFSTACGAITGRQGASEARAAFERARYNDLSDRLKLRPGQLGESSVASRQLDGLAKDFRGRRGCLGVSGGVRTKVERMPGVGKRMFFRGPPTDGQNLALTTVGA